MKLGTDFWFWVRLIIEILKAILGFKPEPSNPGLSAGNRAFNAVLGQLVDSNEDEKRVPADFQALVAAELTKPAKQKG